LNKRKDIKLLKGLFLSDAFLIRNEVFSPQIYGQLVLITYIFPYLAKPKLWQRRWQWEQQIVNGINYILKPIGEVNPRRFAGSGCDILGLPVYNANPPPARLEFQSFLAL